MIASILSVHSSKYQESTVASTIESAVKSTIESTIESTIKSTIEHKNLISCSQSKVILCDD